MVRQPYSSDLTDPQWQRIEPLVPSAKPGGRPHEVDMREVVNALLYLNRTGCQWRMIPHEFPPWQTVYDYKRRFEREGVWQTIYDTLREQVRQKSGREKTPSAAILDSQSVKTAEKGGPAATTRARRSKAVNATWWWTPWA